jgi:hypothetical protein
VYYALNESGWTPAVTANGWTNWTADLVSAPGANTIKVYAVDLRGNVSATNTVRIRVPESSQTTNSSNVGESTGETSTVAATLGLPVYANGEYTFEVTGALGTKYVVEASTDLVNWIPVEINTAPFIFVDRSADRFNQRFYRAVSMP